MNKRTKYRIAKVLKNTRKKNNLSLSQLARILKVKPATVSHYENSKIIPPLKILEIYRSQFNLDLNSLLGKEMEVV